MTGGFTVADWWSLPGPRAFVARVVETAVGSDGIVIADAPSPRPTGLAEAITSLLARDFVLKAVAIDASTIGSTRSIAHELAGACGVLASGIGTVAEFVEAPELTDIVFVVDGITKTDLLQWSLFLRAFAQERRRAQPIGGPIFVIFAPPGLTTSEHRQLAGQAAQQRWLGYVGRMDSIGWLVQHGARLGDSLLERVGTATAVEVAAWSRELLECLAALDTEEQASPHGILEALAKDRSWPFPCWQNGLVDYWDDIPVPHAAAAMAHHFRDDIERRIWTAQLSILLPFTDEVRRGVIRTYFDALATHANPQNPYLRPGLDPKFGITSPWRLEWNEVRTILSPLVSDADLRFFGACKFIRDRMAHFTPLEGADLRRISERWDQVRDEHTAAVRGWDWPRAGQAITVACGSPFETMELWTNAEGTSATSLSPTPQTLSLSSTKTTLAAFHEVRRQVSVTLRSGQSIRIDANGLSHEQIRQLAPTDFWSQAPEVSSRTSATPVETSGSSAADSLPWERAPRSAYG